MEAIVVPVLAARAALRTQYDALHRMVLELARRDPICLRLMTAPGVGPVVALTYRTVIDNPARFAKSRSVGAPVGLTPRIYQSGEVSRMGRVSRSGDANLRALMYEAALVLMTGRGNWSSLKAWGIAIARRRGTQKAIVAVGRCLAVILHRMWVDGTDFR